MPASSKDIPKRHREVPNAVIGETDQGNAFHYLGILSPLFAGSGQIPLHIGRKS